jgi:hypothetical protein
MTATQRVMSLLEQGIPLSLLIDLAGAGVTSEELLLTELGHTDLALEALTFSAPEPVLVGTR